MKLFRLLKRFNINNIALTSLALASVFAGCNKKSASTPPPTEFDQTAMLTNIADNLIVPAYQELSTQSDHLVTSLTQFATDPSASNLLAVQAQFKISYKAYIHCEPYDFGPANGTVMLINSINYWPTKSAFINSELSDNTGISDAYVNGLGAERKGFPALGYLLFDRIHDNNAVIDSFTTSGTAERRKQFIVALARNIANNAKTVLQEWQTSYSDTFKKNTGTELNTSLSLLLNNFVAGLETSKNKRIGIPIGRKDNFTEGDPDSLAVELPYTDFAKEMLAETTTTLTNLYQGKSGSNDGPGFDDYAKSLNSDGAALNENIKTEFNVLQTNIAAVPSPMQTAVKADPGKTVYNCWVETKKMLVLLKVDLAANLGILITFSDNDGD
ncbi:MAG: imelysin family protein [Chitinophagaceae bacterium]|nr:imelysin family protein [Chitinophagaceae bacterium]